MRWKFDASPAASHNARTKGREVKMSESVSDEQIGEIGLFIALAHVEAGDAAANAAVTACHAFPEQDGGPSFEQGRRHGAVEIVRAAVDLSISGDLPPLKNCEVCTGSAPEKRFCAQIGAALANADPAAASAALNEFDRAASRADDLAHASGISTAASLIVQVAGVELGQN